MAAIFISIVASIISGTVLFFLQWYFKKKDKRDEHREVRRCKETSLVLKSIKAVGKLTVANSIALRDGKTNGEMHSALEDYDEVDRELQDYLIDEAARK